MKNFLNAQTKSISIASFILMGSYLASGILGLLRDRLLAANLGAGNESDIYYAAFTVPDFVALILIFGAISAAIIPIFSSYLVRSKEEAWVYASNLLNIFLSFLIAVCVLLIIFAPFFISIIAPGFSEEKKAMTVVLMRIMFLSPIILGTSNIISGILQVFHRFLVTALAPLMYNIGIIIGVIFFLPRIGLPGLAWGVVLGGVLHLLIQIPAFLSSGFRYRRTFDVSHKGVQDTLRLMTPRSLGLGATQFNTIVITAIASTLGRGSISIFNYANNLSSILVNMIAVSLSTAVFPSMSLAYSKHDKADFEKKFSNAFRQILFLTIPASILFFILRAQIVRVILGTGRFNWVDTRLTAACLGIAAFGLCAQGLIFIISKTFYAAHNTKIPAFISMGAVAFNIVLTLSFVHLLKLEGAFFSFMQLVLRLQDINTITVVALPLAFTITVILQMLLLATLLYKKIKVFRLSEVRESLYKIIIATAIMAAATLFTRQALVQYFAVSLQTFTGVFLQLVVSAGVGIILYLLASLVLQSKELKSIKESFIH